MLPLGAWTCQCSGAEETTDGSADAEFAAEVKNKTYLEFRRELALKLLDLGARGKDAEEGAGPSLSERCLLKRQRSGKDGKLVPKRFLSGSGRLLERSTAEQRPRRCKLCYREGKNGCNLRICNAAWLLYRGAEKKGRCREAPN
jgi:hypothetical protein